ncbi:hypothetical protein VUR80DRAFT_8890 [Thermomyces stellatus]
MGLTHRGAGSNVFNPVRLGIGPEICSSPRQPLPTTLGSQILALGLRLRQKAGSGPTRSLQSTRYPRWLLAKALTPAERAPQINHSTSGPVSAASGLMIIVPVSTYGVIIPQWPGAFLLCCPASTCADPLLPELRAEQTPPNSEQLSFCPGKS